jgi:hypothetical protein
MLIASVPVTGSHWSPLAEGEVVVVSGGKLVERASMQTPQQSREVRHRRPLRRRGRAGIPNARSTTW